MRLPDDVQILFPWRCTSYPNAFGLWGTCRLGLGKQLVAVVGLSRREELTCIHDEMRWESLCCKLGSQLFHVCLFVTHFDLLST